MWNLFKITITIINTIVFSKLIQFGFLILLIIICKWKALLTIKLKLQIATMLLITYFLSINTELYLQETFKPLVNISPDAR